MSQLFVGQHGLPGESGGNVEIVFNKEFGVKKLTIASNGGHGSPGQDGGKGQDGRDGSDAPGRITKTEFMEKYPSMAVWNDFKSNSNAATIKSNVYNTRSRKGEGREFHLEGETSRGDGVTISTFSGASRGFVALVEGDNWF